MNKRICILIPGWITKVMGGAEWQCYILSEELLKRGWALEVVTIKDQITKSQYINSKISYITYKKYKSCFITFVLIFLKLLKTDSAIYYVRTDARILRGACRLYTWIFNKRMVFAVGSDNDTMNISLLKNLNFNAFYILKFVDRCITEAFVRWGINADALVAQTERQKEILEKRANKNVIVISNSFRIPLSDICSKENIILWVGNIRDLNNVENVKQPRCFIDLAHIFSKENWQFIMIGRGTKELNCESHNLKLLGELSHEEVEGWYKKSKIYINTSIVEGFPNTFLEAIFFKCIIVSLSVDIDNLLAENKLGFISGNNFQRLIMNLKSVMDKYETKEIQDMSERAYNFFIKRINPEENVSKLIRLLELL